MNRALRAAAAATTAAAVISAPTAAAAAPQDAGRAALQRGLDDITASVAVGALAEVRDEHGVWRGSSGTAALGTQREVPADGRFRAGSITKTFLATVVLQLVDDGELRLDDTVEEWLPGAVPGGDRVTVRHLLDHTSGLYDFKKTLPMPPTQEFLDNRWRTWTADELVGRAVAEGPDFEPPGSEFSYSNTNYALLGRIVEEAGGRTYGEEIKHRVIAPLQLTETSMPGTSPQIRGPHPRGYVPTGTDGAPLLDYTEMNPSMLGASGELITTAADLNRFVAALLDGDLLPEHLLDAMRTPGIEGGKPYGLGLAWRETACGVRVYGNDGDALTYQAWSYATEDGRRQVTIALTPDHSGDTDPAVDALLEQAVCD